MKYPKFKTSFSVDSLLVKSLFFIAFYYLTYRYPLAINSTGTSPTYSDTPFILQIAKYMFIMLSVVFYLTIKLLAPIKLKLNPAQQRLNSLLLMMLVMAIITFYNSLDNRIMLNVEVIFFVIVFLIINTAHNNVENLENLFKNFTFLAIFFNFVQICLFFTIGRLPALAYENSLSVRFGSLWDDPNGFGVFLGFMIPFSVAYFKSMRYFIALVLLLSLLLTQSLTAIASIIAAVFLGKALLLIHSYKVKYLIRILTMLMFTVISIFVVYFNTYLVGKIKALLELKKGSIDGHSSMFNVFFEKVNGNILLGWESAGVVIEPGWLSLVLNQGVFFTLCYSIVIIWAIFRYMKILTNGEPASAVAVGGYYFLITFLIVNFNLPMFYVFPINLIVVLIVSMAFYKNKPNPELINGVG